ncbi:Hsp70 family protein [bacterium]|nr:Hsp70 family protein [bacterium]
MKTSGLEAPRQYLTIARGTDDKSAIRSLIVRAGRELPKTPEALELFASAFELLDRIEDPAEKRLALLDFVKEVPCTPAFSGFYFKAAEAAIIAADALDEKQRRITELLRLANEIPKTQEFTGLRLLAWRLALGLPDRPRFAEPDLERIASELPKASDISFFAGYAILGVARLMPRDGPFLPVYKEAMELAIRAAEAVAEPYYRRYACLSIGDELPRDGEFGALRLKAFEGAYRATLAVTDPFGMEYCLIELFQAVPKSRDFFPLIQKIIEDALSFFTVRKWMEDVDVFDVVDYILSAEDHDISDSKKNRFSREKYSKAMSKELLKFGESLNDTRFIETLRPYTHVWIRPQGLRDSVKKVVARLESLKTTYHGAEVERPVFVSELHPETGALVVKQKDLAPRECISIDLGATNTVVMRKKKDEAPDFMHLGPICRQYDSIHIVPTLLSAETNNIGAEAAGGNPVSNMKQLLLEGNPRGREHMERFIRILYQHMKKATVNTGWFSILPRNAAEVVYMTVPVGYQDYSSAVREIASKVMKGARVELIEEPLAAAVGYQVADDRDRLIMVIDFGGSTLNTMVVRLNMDEVHIVAKPERALMLGGHDIDHWLAEHLSAKAGITGASRESLRLAAEEVKIRLSERREVPFVWDGMEAGKVARDEFEEVLEKREFYATVDRAIINVIKRAEKVGVRKEAIEAILLTGGSSQIPSFKDKIGDIFPELRAGNLIYDHSPLTAVGMGAALYGTRDVTDRHLAMAYALRYAPHEKDVTHSFCIVLEKGEQLPLEKAFRLRPARKLGLQREITIELFEIPERLLARRWVVEDGIEYLKQELKETAGEAMPGLKPFTLVFEEAVPDEVHVAFCVSGSGEVSLKYGPHGKTVETGLKLQ